MAVMSTSPAVRRLVSGGQTGADRAALDVAIRLGIPYGGWCPRGGRAEDLPDPPGLLGTYPELVETPTTDSSVRTEWNVRDSDATLLLTDRPDSLSGGTALTRDLAVRLGRPGGTGGRHTAHHGLRRHRDRRGVRGMEGQGPSRRDLSHEQARPLLADPDLGACI